MAIENATTTVLTIKSAQCPYSPCKGLRLYFLHPDTGYPTPVDAIDVNIDAKRVKNAIGGARENDTPYNVTVTRQKELINVGQEDERYKATDSFVLSGESLTVDELEGNTVILDFEDPRGQNRRKVRRKVASNTEDTLTLVKPLPIQINTTLEDVNVTVLTKQSDLTSRKIKRLVQRKLWKRYIFICDECNKPYFVDKP